MTVTEPTSPADTEDVTSLVTALVNLGWRLSHRLDGQRWVLREPNPADVIGPEARELVTALCRTGRWSVWKDPQAFSHGSGLMVIELSDEELRQSRPLPCAPDRRQVRMKRIEQAGRKASSRFSDWVAVRYEAIASPGRQAEQSLRAAYRGWERANKELCVLERHLGWEVGDAARSVEDSGPFARAVGVLDRGLGDASFVLKFDDPRPWVDAQGHERLIVECLVKPDGIEDVD